MKIFLLDTNVLLHDPTCLSVFGNNKVVIPISVLDELDKHKNRPDDVGRNARTIARTLDALRKEGCLSDGVKVGDTTVQVELNHSNFVPESLDATKVDNKILSTALGLMKDGENIIVVTKDINLRVKCDALKIIAEDYEKDKVAKEPDSLYSGIKTTHVSSELINSLYTSGKVTLNVEANMNQYFVVKSFDNESQSALVRYIGNCEFVLCKDTKKDIYGIHPRNVEQRAALDMLMNPDIKLVTIIGKAGSGKTLVTLAAALQQVFQKNIYQRILVSRPIQPMGKDIGFLPGDLNAKLSPWMQPIYDNLELLMGLDYQMLDTYKEEGTIQVEPLTYIRGRSIPNSFMIVDECFPYDQYIFTDKGKMKIGTLYNKFINKKELPKIYSFNEQNQSFEWSNMVNAWNRGSRELVEIKLGKRRIKCTSNHRFLTDGGWKEAGQLFNGDIIQSTKTDVHESGMALNSNQHQVLLGSFLGDGNIASSGKQHQYRLRISHSIKQDEYCSWKGKLFGCETQIKKNGGWGDYISIFQTKTITLKKSFPQTKTTCPQWILDEIDARGIAIWLMDDGSINKFGSEIRISTCSFDEDTQKRIVEMLEKFNIQCKYVWYKATNHKSEGYFYIVFNKENSKKLIDLVGPYIHSSMAYKIKFESFEQYLWNETQKNISFFVVDEVNQIEETQEVFDIEVEGNHNFVACFSNHAKDAKNYGLIAHNCQNLSLSEVKTIITRMGENSKIVLTGDVEQIDALHLDFSNNGLSHVVEKFKEYDISGHITLRKGERSKLATLASEIL